MEFTEREKDLIKSALQNKLNDLSKQRGHLSYYGNQVSQGKLRIEWNEVDAILYRFVVGR